GDELTPYSVTITATNADGGTATTTFSVSFTDVAPTVARNSAAVTAAENASASNTGTFSDFDDAVTNTASRGSIRQSGSQSGTWSWSQTGTTGDSGTVTITATNADGSTATTTFTVTFTAVGSNQPPQINQTPNQSVSENSGSHTVNLSGINDGDGGTQN